jgi:hypothetical protein
MMSFPNIFPVVIILHTIRVMHIKKPNLVLYFIDICFQKEIILHKITHYYNFIILQYGIIYTTVTFNI